MAGDAFYGDDKATLGDRIAVARENLGLSSEEFAQRFGVLHETLESWEADDSEPRANRLQMLAGALGVSLVWLLTGEGEGGEADRSDDSSHHTRLLAELREISANLAATVERLTRLEAELA